MAVAQERASETKARTVRQLQVKRIKQMLLASVIVFILLVSGSKITFTYGFLLGTFGMIASNYLID